jgi:hypothetical protein
VEQDAGALGLLLQEGRNRLLIRKEGGRCSQAIQAPEEEDTTEGVGRKGLEDILLIGCVKGAGVAHLLEPCCEGGTEAGAVS